MDKRLTEKIDKAIGSHQIGDVVFEEHELGKIQREIQEQYDNAIERGRTGIDVLKRYTNIRALTVLLVNYAREWENGKESGFWQELLGKALDESKSIQTSLYDPFEKVFGNGRVFITPNGKRSFYSTFLYHALAPKSSFEAFVKLIWQEFYRDPELMNADYDPEDALIPRITVYLKKLFADQAGDMEEDFRISTSSYAIRSGIKYAFMQYPEDEMTEFLRRILSRMDDWYYNETVETEKGMIEALVAEAMPGITRLDSGSSHAKRASTGHRSLPDVTRLNPAYRMDTEEGPMLVLPESRVFDEQIEQVQVELYLEDKCIKSLRRFVNGQNLKRRLDRIEIPLLPLLKEHGSKASGSIALRFVLKAGDLIIIDTEDKLYRPYLLFDGNSETQKLYCDCAKAYTLLSLDRKWMADKRRSMEIGAAYEQYRDCIAVIYPKDEQSLYLNERTTIFTDNTESSFVHPMRERIPNVHIRYGDSAYPVFDALPTLQLTTKENIAQYDLYVNSDLRKPLKTCAVQVAWDQWRITLPSDNDAHLYDVVIRNAQRQTIAQTVFGIAPNLRVIAPKKPCYGSERSFEVICRGETRTFELDRRGAPVIMDDYLVTVDRLRWRLDDAEWRMSEMHKPIWYREAPLHNNAMLEIDKAALGNHDIQITINDKLLSRKCDKEWVYRLGDALTEAKRDRCEICALIDGDVKYPLLTAVKKPMLTEAPKLILEDGRITFDARECFVGDRDRSPRFLTVLSDGDAEYSIETGIVGQTDIPRGMEEGYYDCSFSVKEDFLSATWTRLPDEYEICIGDPLKGVFDCCKLSLDKTKYMVPGEKPKTLKIKEAYLYNISSCAKEMGEYIYRAELSGVGERAMDVRFSWDGGNEEKPIIRLLPSDEELAPDEDCELMLSVDDEKGTLTAEKPDEKKGLYSFRSIHTRRKG